MGIEGILQSQFLNVAKCSVRFDSNTPLDVRRRVGAVLGMPEVADQGKYLGLPSHIGCSKREVFRYIVGKVEDKIRGWKGKFLSQAGKEVMIKAVTAAIPNYVMNCFKLPVGTIDNLNSSIASFYWGNAEGEKGIHWKAWEKLCDDKFEGTVMDVSCILCNDHEESLTHLLLTCQFSRRLWHMSPWMLRTDEFPGRFFKDWWVFLTTKLQNQEGNEVLPQIVCTLWSLWKYRNNILFNEFSLNQEMIINQGCNLATDFIKAMGACHPTAENQKLTHSNSIEQGRWRPPRSYYIKLNCDAGWWKDSRSGTVKIVARGDKGDYKGAFFKQLMITNSALVAEALAIRESLQFASENKFSSVEIESDCKEIVRVLNSEIKTPVEVEVVVEDILYLTRYLEVKFQYVKRAINNAAHNVAHWDHGGGDGSKMAVLTSGLANSSPVHLIIVHFFVGPIRNDYSIRLTFFQMQSYR